MQWIPRLFLLKVKKLNKNRIIQTFLNRYKIIRHGFPFLATLGHLSYKTGIPYTYLLKIVRRTVVPYHKFFIRKQSGGKRQISAPFAGIKFVQQWILRNILNKCKESPYSFAYQSDKSIKDCAEQHLAAKWLIKIDITQFFESLSEIQVYRIFKDIGYNPLLSFQLARLCTICKSDLRMKGSSNYRKLNYWRNHHNYKFFFENEIGHLPQGAPTSPKLANLIVKAMDEEIAAALSTYEVTYTRYADDITISGLNSMPQYSFLWQIINSVYGIIKKYGLRPNRQKLKIIYTGSRKIVLGLNVEDSILHLNKHFKNNLECHLYYIKKDVQTHIQKRNFDSYLGLKHHIDGLLNYVKQIEPQYYQKLESKNLIPNWVL